MTLPLSSDALVTYGLPLFWIGVGVVQWFWPSAIFVGFSHGDVTPGARAFATLWLVLGSTLAYLFVPWLAPFGGWLVPGHVLLLLGGLQSVHPVWSIPIGEQPHRLTAALLSGSGAIVLLFGLL